MIQLTSVPEPVIAVQIQPIPENIQESTSVLNTSANSNTIAATMDSVQKSLHPEPVVNPHTIKKEIEASKQLIQTKKSVIIEDEDDDDIFIIEDTNEIEKFYSCRNVKQKPLSASEPPIESNNQLDHNATDQATAEPLIPPIESNNQLDHNATDQATAEPLIPNKESQFGLIQINQFLVPYVISNKSFSVSYSQTCNKYLLVGSLVKHGLIESGEPIEEMFKTYCSANESQLQALSQLRLIDSSFIASQEPYFLINLAEFYKNYCQRTQKALFLKNINPYKPKKQITYYESILSLRGGLITVNNRLIPFVEYEGRFLVNRSTAEFILFECGLKLDESAQIADEVNAEAYQFINANLNDFIKIRQFYLLVLFYFQFESKISVNFKVFNFKPWLDKYPHTFKLIRYTNNFPIDWEQDLQALLSAKTAAKSVAVEKVEKNSTMPKLCVIADIRSVVTSRSNSVRGSFSSSDDRSEMDSLLLSKRVVKVKFDKAKFREELKSSVEKFAKKLHTSLPTSTTSSTLTSLRRTMSESDFFSVNDSNLFVEKAKFEAGLKRFKSTGAICYSEKFKCLKHFVNATDMKVFDKYLVNLPPLVRQFLLKNSYNMSKRPTTSLNKMYKKALKHWSKLKKIKKKPAPLVQVKMEHQENSNSSELPPLNLEPSTSYAKSPSHNRNQAAMETLSSLIMDNIGNYDLNEGSFYETFIPDVSIQMPTTSKKANQVSYQVKSSVKKKRKTVSRKSGKRARRDFILYDDSASDSFKDSVHSSDLECFGSDFSDSDVSYTKKSRRSKLNSMKKKKKQLPNVVQPNSDLYTTEEFDEKFYLNKYNIKNCLVKLEQLNLRKTLDMLKAAKVEPRQTPNDLNKKHNKLKKTQTALKTLQRLSTLPSQSSLMEEETERAICSIEDIISKKSSGNCENQAALSKKKAKTNMKARSKQPANLLKTNTLPLNKDGDEGQPIVGVDFSEKHKENFP